MFCLLEVYCVVASVMSVLLFGLAINYWKAFALFWVLASAQFSIDIGVLVGDPP